MRNTLSELPIFLGSVYGGMVIGAVYDVFRFLRLPFRGKLSNGVIDLIFYGAAGVVAALTMLIVNGGEIRMYVLLGIVGGCALYVKTVGKLTSLIVARLPGGPKPIGRR